MGELRPDLCVQLSDGPLLIEIAVTSFIDERKQELIQELGIRTVEIDLSPWLFAGFSSLDDIRTAVLHQFENKKWVYPVAGSSTFASMHPSMEQELSVSTEAVPARFKIFGMWVVARKLPFGAIAVKSQVYNPHVAAFLKQLARHYGGRYVPEYKNWLFQPWAEALVIGELEALNELSGQVEGA